MLPYGQETLIILLYVMYVERVAEQLRHWTQDLGVWGSIPEVPVRCKSLGQSLNLHCLWPSSRNGYLVHRSKVALIVAVVLCAILAGGKGKA